MAAQGLLLLLLVLFLFIPSINANEVHIGCHGDRRYCNLTNEVLLSNVGNSTIVAIVSDVIVLLEHIQLTNLQNISFMSRNGAVIDCDSPYSGLSFVSIKNLSISNVSLHNCGAHHNSTSANGTNSTLAQLLTTALYLENCTNVNIYGLDIRHSVGTGLTLFNCIGEVGIIESKFMYNGATRNISGGSGLYIEFSYCAPDWYNRCGYITTTANHDGHYNITGCVFEGNNVSRILYNSRPKHSNNSYQGLGKGGGGLFVMFKGLTHSNIISISNVTVQHNNAIGSVDGQYNVETAYGGGLFLQFQDYSADNTVSISHSLFHNNIALKNGGGGLDIGYEYLSPHAPTGNTITLDSVTMTMNRAAFGGGLSFFSSASSTANLNISISFTNCRWINNTATFGSALALGPQFSHDIRGIFPMPFFKDCFFDGNQNIKADSTNSSIKEALVGSGALFFKSFTIIFNGSTTFTGSMGSAVYNVDGILRVSDNSTLTFTNNTGIKGAAITLIGPASIQVGDHSVLNFVNNTAFQQGGAISAFAADIISSRTFGLCFIQFINDPVNTSTFIFENNHADGNYGNDIYLTSLLPCARYCPYVNISHIAPGKILNKCVRNFTFLNGNQSIGTESRIFKFNRSSTEAIPVIPGKVNKLPVNITDELGTKCTAFFKVRLEDKSDTSIELKDTSIAGPNIEVRGDEGATATLIMEAVGFLNNSLALKIKISSCPPGFFNDNGTCICSLNHKYKYDGIYTCLSHELRALARVGYWIGYLPTDSNSSHLQLVTGTCPLGFCTESSNGTVLLPSRPEALEDVMCTDQNRTGILCGECKENHSVYYHSRRYICGSNEHCHLGILFYLLSEILPVTLIFTLTILLRINFTSGYLKGFVLFAQMLDTLSIEANGGIVLQNGEKALAEIAQFVYSPFNLDLFRMKDLSFCFAKGLNFLEISAIKFVTLIYCLVLVLLLVVVLRVNLCYKVQLLCFKTRLTNSSSLINGLSAFLILCYSLCVRTCYQILNMGTENTKCMSGSSGMETWNISVDHTFLTSCLPRSS